MIHTTESKVSRAIPGDMGKCSVTLSDGAAGVLSWADLLPGGTMRLRLGTVRPAPDGSALLVDRHTYTVEGLRQGQDEVVSVPAALVRSLLEKGGESVKKVFSVEGQHGPMTLCFQYAGPGLENGLSAGECQALTQEDVQLWYTFRGWPKAGMLSTTDRRGRVRGYWQMV